jgi:cellulose synthase (UDP-forming)
MHQCRSSHVSIGPRSGTHPAAILTARRESEEAVGIQVDETDRSTPVSNDRVLRWWDYPIFVLLTVINLSAVAYFLWYCVNALGANLWQLAAVATPLGGSLVLFELRWFSLPLVRRPRCIPPGRRWRVGVATTFVPEYEPIEMLEETLVALLAIDYPHETWVLDEGDDQRVKTLCQRLGALHFSRKNVLRYQTETGPFQARSKHGNYNAWLHEVGYERYDLIAAFDPDHVPIPAFLTRVIGYFSDADIGYVQAAQIYYNQRASFIARGAAEETYAYYSSVQEASYALGYPIVTGCHNTHRTNALRAVGGFAPHQADDLLLTLMYRAAGWRGIYVPERLAVGLTPVDWNGYLNQQRRWARSVLDVKFRWYWRFARHLPKREWPVSFLHGLYYLSGVGTPFAILVISVGLVLGTQWRILSLPGLVRLLILFASFNLCEFYRQRFYLDWRNEAGIHWRAGLLRYAKWPYFLLAFVEALVGRRLDYSITAKSPGGSRSWGFATIHLSVTLLIVTALLLASLGGQSIQPGLAVVAGLIALSSLAVSLTMLLTFPPPYDPSLRAL